MLIFIVPASSLELLIFIEKVGVCYGLNCVPKEISGSPWSLAPVNMLVFGDKILADVVSKDEVMLVILSPRRVSLVEEKWHTATQGRKPCGSQRQRLE